MLVMNPKFIVFVGPMFGSKTTSMFMCLERYELQGKKVRLFKPNIDDRYSKSEVITHSGWSRPATQIKDGLDILKEIESDPPNVIALDEAFMVQDSAKVLIWLFKNGMNIVVSSIELSFKGKSMKEIEKMLPWATEIHKNVAVCSVCGSDAHYTYRKLDVDDDIIIGGNDTYEPRCFKCHPLINERMFQ